MAGFILFKSLLPKPAQTSFIFTFWVPSLLVFLFWMVCFLFIFSLWFANNVEIIISGRIPHTEYFFSKLLVAFWFFLKRTVKMFWLSNSLVDYSCMYVRDSSKLLAHTDWKLRKIRRFPQRTWEKTGRLREILWKVLPCMHKRPLRRCMRPLKFRIHVSESVL